MKRWGGRKQIAVGLATAILILPVILVWLADRPPTHDCAEESSPALSRFHPVKVVVQPWRGRHEVYGIFVLPLRYRSGRTYSGAMSVSGYKTEFIPDWNMFQEVQGVVAEPGYYLVQAYVPTHIAILFLLKGQFGDLQVSCNWTVELVKRGSR